MQRENKGIVGWCEVDGGVGEEYVGVGEGKKELWGMVRRKMTPNPSGSTLQPIMSSVSGHRCSPAFSILVAPPSPARKMTAAAPSPNRLTATTLALVSSS